MLNIEFCMINDLFGIQFIDEYVLSNLLLLRTRHIV